VGKIESEVRKGGGGERVTYTKVQIRDGRRVEKETSCTKKVGDMGVARQG